MKRYLYLLFAATLMTAPRMNAEFLQIDMSIFGMD